MPADGAIVMLCVVDSLTRLRSGRNLGPARREFLERHGMGRYERIRRLLERHSPRRPA
jgi:hypothetical protein